MWLVCSVLDLHSYKIGELGRVITGKTPPTKRPELLGDGAAFITPTDLDETSIYAKPERRLSQVGEEAFARSLLPAQAVCFTCIASVGKMCMTSEPSLTNQQINSIIVDEARFDPRWVFYALKTKRDYVRSIASGSATPIINKTSFSNVELDCPLLETQQRIAAILGAYDDLIEVNRQRIIVLEEMAGGLFEEWFVRFRFPGHEDVPIVGAPDGPLPEGWEWVNLYDAAEVGFGFAFKSKAFSTEPVGARVVRIRDVQEGRTSTWTPEEFADRYCVRNGDILVGMDGNFHTNVWVGGDAALNQRVTRLRPTLARSSGWLLQAVKPKIKFFEDTISGTTVAHLGAKHLKTIYLPVADDETQRQADAFFSPVDEELVNLHVANEKLAASRDLLLPRLISGQLSVEIAERELEDAA